MEYLSLQIDNQWAYLDEGTEIALEGNNPLFSDAGSKSYLFRLRVESNRHIFGTSDEIYGESYYKAIDGKRSTLYIMGIPVMTGKIALEDEVYMDEDGYIAVNLVSGNLEFAQMIEGMNCREVELLDEIQIGYIYDSIQEVQYTFKDGVPFEMLSDQSLSQEFALPKEHLFLNEQDAEIEENVSHPYPVRKFCSIRLMTNRRDEMPSTNYPEFGVYRESDFVVFAKNDNLRLAPPVCFYVLYFLDRLMCKLNIYVAENQMLNVEDLCRLAIVNTGCFFRLGEEVSTDRGWKTLSWFVRDNGTQANFNIQTADWKTLYKDGSQGSVFVIKKYKAIATSENFCDVAVSDFIDSMCNAFGLKFLYDSQSGSMRMIFIKDVLKSTEIKSIPCDVLEERKVENEINGFCLRYSESDEGDTNFFYYDYQRMVSVPDYSEIMRRVNPKENACLIDPRNGNAYRVKVDERALSDGNVEFNPSLFEVGGFNKAVYGDCSVEEYVEEKVIKFSPIRPTVSDIGISSPKNEQQIKEEFSFFVDVDAGLVFTSSKATLKYPGGSTDEVTIKYPQMQGEEDTISGYSSIASNTPGFMLGIMRGPGNDASVNYYDTNYDGEGNQRVSFTSANYAFTSDSIDHCNRDFDYNGKAEEGVDYDGRFSLKLRARKYDKDGNPIKLYDKDGNEIVMDDERENRGLYDKFWKEYAYFTVNKKILRITCRMEIADLVSFDWTKRYRIGNHVGFIASYSYSVNTQGMSDVELDLYYL